MPTYWGSFPEVGQKQNTEKRKRLNNGNNNGQAMHGARKHAWRTQVAGAKNIPCANDKKFTCLNHTSITAYIKYDFCYGYNFK